MTEKPHLWREVAPGHDAMGKQTKSYGGLAGRYRAGSLRLIRAIDPFTGATLHFQTALAFDNWLTRAFDPLVLRCTVPDRKQLAYLSGGKIKTAPFDLVTEFRCGRLLADVVVSNTRKQSMDQFEASEIACAFGYECSIRHQSQIRANQILLENLDRMCQHLVVFGLFDNPLSELIVKRVPLRGRVTVREIRDQLSREEQTISIEGAFDTALFGAYRASVLTMNIDKAPYGPETLVANSQ